MTTILLAILTSEIFWTAVIGIGGFLVERYAPSWVPFFNKSKKLADELLDLHSERETPNQDIADKAMMSGLKIAAKVLSFTADK